MDNNGNAGQKLLSMEEVSSFINDVKVEFQDKMEKYDEFVKVLYDFKVLRIDKESATAKVEELFKGHSDLILKFNSLTLNGYQITNDDRKDTKAKHDIEQDQIGSDIIDKFEQMRDQLEKFESKVIGKIDQITLSAQHSSKTILDIVEHGKKHI